jgi:hypothetical protein
MYQLERVHASARKVCIIVANASCHGKTEGLSLAAGSKSGDACCSDSQKKAGGCCGDDEKKGDSCCSTKAKSGCCGGDKK